MDPIPAHLEADIQSRLREHQTFGLALCGFDAEGIRFAGGVGFADLDRSESVTPATVFRVASISKLLTTALALRAVDAGFLDLDDPVNRHLPSELRIRGPHGEPATSSVRTLLSHSSGLPAGTRGADELGQQPVGGSPGVRPLRSSAASSPRRSAPSSGSATRGAGHAGASPSG